MPRITFIEDVTLPNEKEGTGPHYRIGYSPDVSEDEAAKWIAAGKAVRGVVAVDPPPTKEKPFEIPTFRKRRFGGPT